MDHLPAANQQTDPAHHNMEDSCSLSSWISTDQSAPQPWGPKTQSCVTITWRLIWVRAIKIRWRSRIECRWWRAVQSRKGVVRLWSTFRMYVTRPVASSTIAWWILSKLAAWKITWKLISKRPLWHRYSYMNARELSMRYSLAWDHLLGMQLMI